MSIGKVQIDIEEFLFETAEPCLDDKKGNAWLNSFRDTLQYKGRKAKPLPFGIDCIVEAEGFNAQQAIKRMTGIVKNELGKSGLENPTPKQIEDALLERYGSEYVTYRNAIRAKEQVLLRRERIKQRNIEESLGITAGALTREDGEFKSDSGYAANLESSTPADLYGDAESGDASEATTTIPDLSGARESRRTEGRSVSKGVNGPSVRNLGRNFRNKEDFMQWAIDTGLDPDDAGNCWEATMVERGGLTKDGKKVDNLCAYAVQWCRTSAKKRRTA